MKINISEAGCLVLDWLMCHATGDDQVYLAWVGSVDEAAEKFVRLHAGGHMRYCTDGALLVPIMDASGIDLYRDGPDGWVASDNALAKGYGPTMLIAFVRAFLIGKFGAVADVPFADDEDAPAGVPAEDPAATAIPASPDAQWVLNFLESVEHTGRHAPVETMRRVVKSQAELRLALQRLLDAVRCNHEDGRPKTQCDIYREAGFHAHDVLKRFD